MGTVGGGERMCFVLDRKVVAEKDLLCRELMDEFWCPPPPPPYEQLDTTHALLSYFPTDLFAN